MEWISTFWRVDISPFLRQPFHAYKRHGMDYGSQTQAKPHGILSQTNFHPFNLTPVLSVREFSNLI